MNPSNLLAELWGLAIVTVSFAVLLRPQLLQRLLASAENKTMMFLWGLASLVIGLATVSVHNVWVRDWRVIITLLGWLTLFKGLDTLLLPAHMRKRWAKTDGRQWQTVFACLLVLGLVLTYLGFSA